MLKMSLKIIIIGLLMMGVLTACGGESSESEGLTIGETAPAFTLPNATGEDLSLSEYQGEQPVLLYFHMAIG